MRIHGCDEWAFMGVVNGHSRGCCVSEKAGGTYVPVDFSVGRQYICTVETFCKKVKRGCTGFDGCANPCAAGGREGALN